MNVNTLSTPKLKTVPHLAQRHGMFFGMPKIPVHLTPEQKNRARKLFYPDLKSVADVKDPEKREAQASSVVSNVMKNINDWLNNPLATLLQESFVKDLILLAADFMRKYAEESKTARS